MQHGRRGAGSRRRCGGAWQGPKGAAPTMGLLDHNASWLRSVALVMQRKNNSSVHPLQPCHRRATLYLCRQSRRWVVVIESPRITGAVPVHHLGLDSHDARLELLTLAHVACPDATLITTDGAVTSADYEWRVEVRGITVRPGDLGWALSRAFHRVGGRERRVDEAGDRAALPLGREPVVFRPAPLLLTAPQERPPGPPPGDGDFDRCRSIRTRQHLCRS